MTVPPLPWQLSAGFRYEGFWSPSLNVALTRITLGFILILSSHLRLGFPRGLFPVSLPVEIHITPFWLNDMPIFIL